MNATLGMWEYGTTLLTTLSGGLAWQLMTLRGESRGGTFFGARAEPGFRESAAGLAILRQFRWRLWGWTLAGAAVCLAAMAFEMGHGIAAAAPFIGFSAGMTAFALAHRRTRREAIAPVESSVRTASLMVEAEPGNVWLDVLDWLAMLAPPAIPAWSLAFLALHWHEVHPLLGRTLSIFLAVFGLAIGLCCCTDGHWALRYRSRSSDWAPTPGASHKFRTYLGVMQACVWTFIIAEFSALAVMQFGGDRSRTPPFGLPAPLQYLGMATWLACLWGMRWWLSRHMAMGSGDSMADRYWKWGFFYVNPDDSALVVPLRSGLGQSYNFARASVQWVAFAVMAVTIIGVADAFRL
jgi:hypothetical protein